MPSFTLVVTSIYAFTRKSFPARKPICKNPGKIKVSGYKKVFSDLGGVALIAKAEPPFWFLCLAFSVGTRFSTCSFGITFEVHPIPKAIQTSNLPAMVWTLTHCQVKNSSFLLFYTRDLVDAL